MEKVIRATISSGLPALMATGALAMGIIALLLTPREEEPQIVVPMIDVLIEAPGLSARQIERQITTPVEKLLAQIAGVEHVYSVTRSHSATVTLRYYVGEDREDALLNAYTKLYANQDQIPPGVHRWLVKPVEVDDVPILVLALWSDRYDDFDLRRFAAEISTELKAIAQTNRVEVVGGRPRQIRLLLDQEALSARQTTALDVIEALGASNYLAPVGTRIAADRITLIESGDFLNDSSELNALLVNVVDGAPVYLNDVVRIEDGPALPESYTWIDPGPATGGASRPMVAISIAKQPGTNAVWVTGDVMSRIEALKRDLLPPDVHVEVLRDYGDTANEKVNNLTGSLAIAMLTVVVFIGIFLGPRAAMVVGLAVPICYGVTLALDLMFGYTINRVTLFALILSLGLLVDDPITGVDNISRFLREKTGDRIDLVVGAMVEIRSALLMSTLTIILAFTPLAFITGMMGPYMAPMAFNVPVSVAMSTVVAFLVTPWLASVLLSREPPQTDTRAGLYARIISPVLARPRNAKWVLGAVAALFIIAVALPAFRLVPMKLLPFDNKNEFQIIIDLPEGSSLEQTAALASRVGHELRRIPEVQTLAYFVGIPSPMDFNGLVRHYYQRQGPHLADIRVTLADKDRRVDQSHELVLRIRELLSPLQSEGIHIAVVEVPPGPPVLATLVGEIYAAEVVDYQVQRDAATLLANRLALEPHVVDVDTTNEVTQSVMRFVVDKQKAALSGIATRDVAQTLSAANAGTVAGVLNLPRETEPTLIEVRLAADRRADLADLERLAVRGRTGIAKASNRLGLETAPQPLVAVGEIGEFRARSSDLPIYHKDLLPVVYVTAEISGRTPAEVIADVVADRDQSVAPRDWQSRTFLRPGGTQAWSLPAGTRVTFSGEGEWKITLRVFRDMGIAFAFALVAIFIVIRIQVQSALVALIIMSAIPLTFIGIMPGFLGMNLVYGQPVAGAPNPVLFTATAMIGVIALAGIVVRNSLILVEFIRQRCLEGLGVRDAIIDAGRVRMRPILLTAGTTLLGNIIIILDPIFSGLALAIMFGIIASTLFTLIVVPATYYLIFNEDDA